MTRSLIREQLFRLLFRIEFNSKEEMSEQVRLFFEDDVEEDGESIRGAQIPQEEAGYITDKLYKIVDKIPEIDEKIAAASKGWNLDRIGKVEITILRLAVYEMLYDDDIPVGVAIDEAVELSKKYGPDGAKAFVNGILAAIAKDK